VALPQVSQCKLHQHNTRAANNNNEMG